MSLNDYSLEWSDELIATVEVHLHDVHSALVQYYEKHQYSTQPVIAAPVSQGAKARASSSDDDDSEEDREVDDITAANAKASSDRTPSKTAVSVVAPVGSFLLRTCVHSTPFANLHRQNGVGADLVVTIPESKCTQQDLQQGEYLVRRQAFLEEIEVYLRELIRGAQRHLGDGAMGGTSSSKAATDDSEDDDEADASPQMRQNKDAVARLARMEVNRLCMHGSYVNANKPMLRLRFCRATAPHAKVYETFHVNLFFRPAMNAGRVTSAAATRKHPLYSYQILEDYLMPQYMKRLHELCVESANMRKAMVILKCWAHHVGLTSAASGHGEGLNGFVLTAMVAALAEVGIVSPAMSEDNIVRTVWVQITRGFFQASNAAASSAGVGQSMRGVVPMVEEKGQVAVLRLAGDVHNVLFRTSNTFWESVVKPAAEEALQFTRATDLFARTAFQPLALRYDTALTLTNVKTIKGLTSSSAPLANTKFFAAPTEAAFAVHGVVEEALRTRCSTVMVWQLDASTFRVAVRFVKEAEGRSRITRGPPIEDVAAVNAFNAFWGAEMTSARQFPDGAVYRCVLWKFPTEDAGAHTTIALSAGTVTRAIVNHAVHRHIDANAETAVLLGGLEGFLAERIGAEWRDAAPLMQKSLLDASKFVSDLMANLPKTALPCKITGFDIISASERLTEVFPVRPHLALTYTTDAVQSDPAFAGLQTVATIEPIHCVLTIDDKHSIPDTTEAITMMKGAICAQLAKYLQQHYGSSRTTPAAQVEAASSSTGARGKKVKQQQDVPDSDGKETGSQWPIRAFCTSQSVDLIYRGYLFRVYVAHYREVSLLRALKRDAEATVIEQKLFWSVQHSKFMRTLAFGHHSYAKAVRLAKRWVSAMMLYEFIPAEAIELLVANAYLGGGGSDEASMPKTPAGGFLRFVQLLATHDWFTPLVLPFTDDGEGDASARDAASLVRKVADGQGMFIATAYAPTSSPFTENTPRPMIMHRLVQLAKSVVCLLVSSLQQQETPQVTSASSANACRPRVSSCVEAEVFTSDPSAFDVELRLHPHVILQPDRALWVPCGRPTHKAAASAKEVEAAETKVTDAMEDEAPTSTSVAASTEAEASHLGLTRIWQLDELQGDSSKQYVTQLAEREPAAYAVRTVRAAIRDQGMLFYDALAPTSVHIIALTPQPVLRRSHRLHEEVLHVSRGALLPAPPSAFTVPTTRKAADGAKSADTSKSDSGRTSQRPSVKPVVGSKRAAAPSSQKRPRDAEADTQQPAKRVKTVKTKAPAKKPKKSTS